MSLIACGLVLPSVADGQTKLNSTTPCESSASVKDYDAIEKHIIMMADALSDGIIAQFPQKFNGPQPK